MSIMLNKIRPLDSILFTGKQTAHDFAFELSEKWVKPDGVFLVRVDELVDGTGWKVVLYFKTAEEMHKYKQAFKDQSGVQPVVFDFRAARPASKKQSGWA